MRRLILVTAVGLWPALARAQAVDCSDAYGGQATHCERVPCDARFQTFLGEWKGPFEAYVKELSKNGSVVFRPYENTTTYTAEDCLTNTDTGETLIIGHMTDVYPAFSGLPAHTEKSLLITGYGRDGSPFLRIADAKKQAATYRLVYKNAAASLAIWTLSIAGHGMSPEMEYSTVDGRDFSAPGGVDRRAVTIILRVGPAAAPYFKGVIASGFHTRQPQ